MTRSRRAERLLVSERPCWTGSVGHVERGPKAGRQWRIGECDLEAFSWGLSR